MILWDGLRKRSIMLKLTNGWGWGAQMGCTAQIRKSTNPPANQHSQWEIGQAGRRWGPLLLPGLRCDLSPEQGCHKTLLKPRQQQLRGSIQNRGARAPDHCTVQTTLEQRKQGLRMLRKSSQRRSYCSLSPKRT